MGQAYITASTNYLDVVALHSVVMFVPLFVGWAVVLETGASRSVTSAIAPPNYNRKKLCNHS